MNRTKTIWKTVVFAGAMLGSAACSKSKPAATTPPAPSEDTAKTGDEPQPDPCADPTDPEDGADPCADPCADRIRGVSDEGDVGRGFLLS